MMLKFCALIAGLLLSCHVAAEIAKKTSKLRPHLVNDKFMKV